jgi:hypothetical protein
MGQRRDVPGKKQSDRQIDFSGHALPLRWNPSVRSSLPPHPYTDNAACCSLSSESRRLTWCPATVSRVVPSAFQYTIVLIQSREDALKWTRGSRTVFSDSHTDHPGVILNDYLVNKPYQIKGLVFFECICHRWQIEPDRFTIGLCHHTF